MCLHSHMIKRNGTAPQNQKYTLPMTITPPSGYLVVYSGCFLSPTGHDYKGNSSLPECLPWSHPNVTSYGYSGLRFWELEGLVPGSSVTHNYCRNPSGFRDTPWCFVEQLGAVKPEDGCTVERPDPLVSTCHNGMSATFLSLNTD